MNFPQQSFQAFYGFLSVDRCCLVLVPPVAELNGIRVVFDQILEAPGIGFPSFHKVQQLIQIVGQRIRLT